ncbi:hypothetical protein BDR06DRAFT_157513 [Suillus hirtellus]|nr:hypothetical protein BDR06DRAFT_157513 [Suillus hirtellus]
MGNSAPLYRLHVLISYVLAEIVIQKSSWSSPQWFHRVNNIVIEFHHKTGGHVASSERPEELVEDVRKMFAKGSPAFAIVPGKGGYA